MTSQTQASQARGSQTRVGQTQASQTDAATTVIREVVVQASPALAFEVFTARFGEWWPKSHHIGGWDDPQCVLEPREGGRWLERGPNGEECEWGSVLAWEPPHRLVLSWAIDASWQANPDLASEVEVTFTPEDAGTRVVLEHRHLDRGGENWERMRDAVSSGGGWGDLLARYVAVADSAG
ncbi:MAG: SRPBCC family protein [Actinomycetes bacterium]